jgi:hypothetical protein
MRTVRWAHAALLAVVLPACAHGGSNENENPNTTPNKAAVEQQPADSEWVLAQGGEAKSFRQRLRPAYLAATTSDLNTTYVLRQEVVADAPNCDPWAPASRERCDLSELVTNSMR